ncbi:hypothetical protein NH340_JMT06814 [Sarcoptes scabiei]|nr:hypothetical protein NH340_JMT06814 [Sarcoptes scabiei]
MRSIRSKRHSAMDSNRGSLSFISTDNHSVRNVAFSRSDRNLFCSGGNDGQICIYHTSRLSSLKSYSVLSAGVNRFISAVAFSSDGSKILATTSSRRFSVIDVEHGTPILYYDNCAFSSSRDRTPLAVYPHCPNIAACAYINGKGITVLDLRMPLPLDFIFDFHAENISDITFLDSSWPLPSISSCSENGNSLNYGLLSLSSQGVAKATSIDGRLLHTFDFGHAGNSIITTPEKYDSTHDGFSSAWICGGDLITSYVPNKQTLLNQQSNNNRSEISSSSVLNLQHLPSDSNRSIGRNIIQDNSNQRMRTYHSISRVFNSDGNRIISSSNNNIDGPWNQSFNVIISNSNNVNLNVYQIPRQNDLIFGNVSNIDSVRISRAIRSIVSSSHQQIRQYENHSDSHLQSLSYSPFIPGEQQRSSQPSDAINRQDSSSSSVQNIRGNTRGSVENNSLPPPTKLDSQTFEVVKKSFFCHDRWDRDLNDRRKIWRLRFSSNGAHLYAAGEGGFVRVYRRFPKAEIQFVGELFRHRGDVLDMDISAFDEYLVTASRDKTVGFFRLGGPNHGWTEYFEYT